MYKDKRSENVYQLFEKISDHYDGANLRISLGLHKVWKNLLINDLSKKTNIGGKVLDVCCGTGDIAIGISKKRKDLKVTGIDFSPSMLYKADKKGKNLPNVVWERADAMKLPYSDNQFDSVCISFGLRNTQNYEKVLSEMKRVTKKGGYLYCMDSFIPDNLFIRPFYNIYFRYIMPFLGGGFKRYKEYLWLYQSTDIFLRKKELATLFRDIGLCKIKINSRMFGACALIRGKKSKV